MTRTTISALFITGGLTFACCTTLAADPTPPASVESVAQSAGNSAEELAKQLANPIAALISVPLQNNFEFGIGARACYELWGELARVAG